MKLNIRSQLLNFFDDFHRIFQHLWNRMGNNAEWSMLTGSLGCYLECVQLINNLRLFEILFWETRKFFRLLFSCFSENLLLPTFQLQFVQDVVRFYNKWNLQTSTSVTSLNIYITNIDAVYLASHIWCVEVVYKLRVTFGVELSLKKRFLFTEYPKVIHFYWMRE